MLIDISRYGKKSYLKGIEKFFIGLPSSNTWPESGRSKPITKLKSLSINKKIGWCNDVRNKKYNRLIKINKKIKYEKMHRKDYNSIPPTWGSYYKLTPRETLYLEIWSN